MTRPKPKRSRSSSRGGPPVDTGELLLEVARDLYLESGPAHFALREVARRVGVSAAAVYRHFASKEALYQAACARGFLVFSGYLMRALSESTAKRRLVASGVHYRSFALENPHDYRFIFMTFPESPEPKPTARPHAHDVPQDATFRFLVDRVRDCIAAGDLKNGDPDALAFTIWAHVHGLASLFLAGHFQRPTPTNPTDATERFIQHYDASVAQLLDGMAP